MLLLRDLWENTVCCETVAQSCHCRIKHRNSWKGQRLDLEAVERRGFHQLFQRDELNTALQEHLTLGTWFRTVSWGHPTLIWWQECLLPPTLLILLNAMDLPLRDSQKSSREYGKYREYSFTERCKWGNYHIRFTPATKINSRNGLSTLSISCVSASRAGASLSFSHFLKYTLRRGWCRSS